jgi:uncharacterized protein YodC (DUF2158 family)
MVTAPTATSTSKSKPKAAGPQPAEPRLYVGDRVRLHSGGALTCVIERRSNGSLRCAWFDEREKIQRAAFPEAALQFEPDEIWDAKLGVFLTVDPPAGD